MSTVLVRALFAHTLAIAISVVTLPLSASATDAVIDDFNDGDTGDWGFFGGNAAGGGGGPAADRPQEGDFYFSTGWGGEGTASGFYGGAFRNFDNAAQPTPPASNPTFNVWVLNQSDATVDSYTLEITLREDAAGDGWAPGIDESFRFDVSFEAAQFNNEWMLLSVPLNTFTPIADGTPGDGSFTGNLDEVVVVVAGVDGAVGSTVELDFDRFFFSEGTDEPSQVVDDYEGGLPEGSDASGNLVGFFTFSDGSPIGIATTATPPAPRPDAAAGNSVLSMTGNVGSFAGFIHAFESSTLDSWVTQDWSTFLGLRLWVYGANSGTTLFIDVLDNRNPGSSSDDAERYSVSFVDDFDGWRQLQFPFESFTRKEIGNGAPNDGFTLTRIHGWAIGALNTGGNEVTWYFDQAEIYGEAEIPPLAVSFETAGYGIEEGSGDMVRVILNRAMNADDPEQVSVSYDTSPGTGAPGVDYFPTSGSLTFVNGEATEQEFHVNTIDNAKWGGDRSFFVNLTDPVDMELGRVKSATVFVLEDDTFDPQLQDDFETEPFLWDAAEGVSLATLVLGNGDPLARPEQDSREGVLQVSGPRRIVATVENQWCEGPNGNSEGKGNDKSNKGGRQVVVNILSTDGFDATTIDHTTVTFGDASERHVDKKTGTAKRHEEDVDGDGDRDLVFHFERDEIGDYCDAEGLPIAGLTFSGEPVSANTPGLVFNRDFALGQDWSAGDQLSFWYYGTGNGSEVTVTLKDNRIADPGPGGWSLAWAEEFNEEAGTQPDPANWTFETGDGSAQGIPGWGNEELQYYTDDPENAAMDGDGNLVITIRDADGSLSCYYGPCEYTSARLISKRKAEFAYGRIEARILVPAGEAGLWPAFWSLGTDIDLVRWPQTGEIDFMEYVSRLPNEIFGTIHGPGYSGGNSYGNIFDFGEPVANSYHTFVVEWQPGYMEWYVDGNLYHTARPEDVSPNPWVFDDPVFLLLNMAIGGNFGGAISPDLVLPQSMAVDYIRIYQAPDSAERFETTFVDSVEGWQRISLPFAGFQRSAQQPDGAPDDGLTLSEVWGYGFVMPDGGEVLLDDIRFDVPPPPAALTVTNLDDSGEGSLRDAIARIADGGTITVDAALTGGTVQLAGPLVPPVSVTIDATAAPGFTLDGLAADRVLIVDPGKNVNVRGVRFINGYGFQLGGAILNNGRLVLELSEVSGSTMTTPDTDQFWQGGGGIYSGDGATLVLRDSTVRDNFSGWTGGGVYSFFNTTTTIERSTISGNTAGDVGGGLRTLGDVTISNSTISGNASTAWHGGAAFITDGAVTMTSSTVTGNTAPAGTTGGMFVGTFGDGAASLEVGNSIVAANGDFGCFLAPFGPGPVSITSLGGNVFTDATCSASPDDSVVGDALLAPLGDNGGPTLTHLPASGSPAIDGGDDAQCLAMDQRGVGRPVGSCDAGSVEQ